MIKPLLDVIFASDKRKNALLFLRDGPKEMSAILDHLSTTRQAMLPQIRTLESHKLVTGSGDIYRLTTIGQLIVDEMATFLGMIDVFDCDVEYWGNHILDFIPTYLLKRMNELGSCTRIEVPLPEMFDEDEHFLEEAERTKYLYMITAFLFPNFKKTFLDLLSKGVDISVIITKELYEKLIQEDLEDFRHCSQIAKIQFFVHPDAFNFLSVSLTDHAVMLRLLTEEGNYDNKRFICSSKSARKWGKDLFEHYRESSTRVDAI